MTAPTPRALAINTLTTHRHGERKEPCGHCASFYGSIYDQIAASPALDALVAERVAAELHEAANEVHRALWAQGAAETRRKSYPTGVAWRGAANRATGILRTRAAALTERRSTDG